MEDKNLSTKSKNYDPQAIIEELKKLKPVEKEYADLFEKTEEIILSQYKTIQRLSDIVIKDSDKGIDDISRVISESYEEFKQQLQIAQYVQRAIFPKKLPSNDIISIKAMLLPMEETSSDFYDIFEILEGRVYGIVIVDVSGHGVSAALVTSMVKMLFSNAVSKYLSPKLVLSYVNKELSKTLKQSSYLSCFYCMIDLYDKEMVYVTAGHTDNLHYSCENSEFTYLNTDSPMVGTDEKYEYEEKKINLEYGDKLILFTDGLIKLANEKGELYNEDEIFNIIKENQNTPTEELLSSIVSSIKNHKGNMKQSDDITILLVDIFKEAKEKIKKGFFKVEESQKLIEYYKKLLKLREQDSDKKGIIEALLNMADVYTALGNYDKAVSFLNDALSLSYGLNDERLSIGIVDKLADLYLKIGNLKKAIEYVNRSVKFYKDSQEDSNLRNAYSLTSVVYYMQRKPDLAIKYEMRSLQLAKKIGDPVNIALSYNRIGVYYHAQNNFEKAMKYYNKGAEITSSLKESVMKAKLINNLGNLHKSFGNFDEALKLFEESLKILTVWEDKITYIVVLENLGELYMKKNEIDKALDYLNKGINMISGLIPSVESSSLAIRSEIYLIQDKIKECLEDCLKTIEIIEETKVDFQRGRIYITVAKCLIKMNEKEKEENKTLIKKISELSNTPVLPEKFFKKAISRSKNPMFAEVNIPALYEYALFLYNTNNKDNALSILKDAYQLSVKYGLTSEKTIIENIAKEYKLDIK